MGMYTHKAQKHMVNNGKDEFGSVVLHDATHGYGS
jgi:hypothetical protein